MKFKVASALLALSVSLSSFANCALSTNDAFTAEILAEKGYHIVDNRADALFHIEVVNEFSSSEAVCKLGLCTAEVSRDIKVTALTSIDMSAFNMQNSRSGTQVFRKKNAPRAAENEKELRNMLDALDKKLQFQYNDCRPRVNE